MHVNPYLVIEDEKYLVDDFKFGFRQKPNAAGVPIEVPVFQGLHVVIRGHYPGFFLERWACASSQSKLVELVLKPLVLGSGPTRVFTFFDAHLVDFTKNYSEKKNPPVEMILKITAGGVRDSFSKSEYAAPWRETFEKPCTVVAQSTTEEACVDSGGDDAVQQMGGMLTLSIFNDIFNKKVLFSAGNMKNRTDVYQLKPAILVHAINSTAERYDINTELRLAHFLAQIEHESDHFNTTEEYASGRAYEGRKDLGNTQAGDGKRFKGRGLIQLTGRTNYKNYSDYVKNKFNENIVFTIEPNNDLIASNIRYAVDAAGWYWKYGSSWGNINLIADNDDAYKVTKAVNGGLNGINDRISKTTKAKKSLGIN